jgi:hypothetical protein
VRWVPQGLLVEPLGSTWSSTHAALPVPEVDANGALRVYFSSRDPEGRSSVGRASVDLDEGVARVEPEPLLVPGALGAFDDSGVTTSSVVELNGRTYLYYTGWSLGRTVPFYLAAGCAVSDDGGASFRRVSPAPILDRSAVDPFLTASPFVLVEDGRWRMWYVSAAEWQRTAAGPRHRYHVRYAESADGVVWQRDGHVCVDFRDETEYAISRPWVVREGDLYRMWFSARGEAYRIGYAESDDGLTWQRLDEAAGISPPSTGWDAGMQAYPAVATVGGRTIMLYNGDDFGRAGLGWAVLRR